MRQPAWSAAGSCIPGTVRLQFVSSVSCQQIPPEQCNQRHNYAYPGAECRQLPLTEGRRACLLAGLPVDKRKVAAWFAGISVPLMILLAFLL